MTFRTARFQFDVNSLFQHRLNNNKNALEVVTGEPGSGKSFLGLSQCEDMNPDFSVENCAFGIKDFVGLLKSSKPKQDIILFEEAGVEFAARRAMSKANIDISSVLNVFRFRQTPTIFTVPDLRMVDLNARRLMNFWVNALRVDKTEQTVIGQFFVVKPYGWEEGLKRYKVRIVCTDTGERVVVDFVRFHKPKSQKLIDDYLKKMEEYKQGILDKIGSSYDELMAPKKGRERTPRKKHKQPPPAGDSPYSQQMKEAKERIARMQETGEDRIY
jgi:hypothetical protein